MRTRDIRKGATRDTWSELTVCTRCMYGLDDMHPNGLYNLFFDGLDVQCIKTFPRDVCGMH